MDLETDCKEIPDDKSAREEAIGISSGLIDME